MLSFLQNFILIAIQVFLPFLAVIVFNILFYSLLISITAVTVYDVIAFNYIALYALETTIAALL